MGEVIDKFKGEYRFLDNSYLAPIEVNGTIYLSVEIAYQTIRLENTGISDMFKSMSSKNAKRLGESLKTSDVNKEDGELLYLLTLEKFKQNSNLRKRLVGTGNSIITDGFLGDILMRVRSELS